ncbi:CRAL-TRIO domain-containing protein [Globomyces pollinis-pini]|nr:CRAL-TRIO domain-containing protein [Globomyces pollinis-pini]
MNGVKNLQDCLNSTLQETQQISLAVNFRDCQDIVRDESLLFRFLKKNKFDLQQTVSHIIGHIDWRINHHIYSLDINTIDPDILKHLENGLFRFFKLDLNGRPVIYVQPNLYNPNVENATQIIQKTVVFCLEILRRWVYALHKDKDSHDELTSQALVVVDLKDFGVSNMDYSLIPLIYEIFRNQYPQLIGQAIVLNYGWLHAGIWGVLRTAMSTEAKGKLQFISTEDMINFIPIDNIPTMYGGLDTLYPISPAICPIIQSYGVPSSKPSLLSAEFNRASPISYSDDGYQYEGDVYYNAKDLPPRVRSAADLQSILYSQSVMTGTGFTRTLSSTSLSKIAKRTKSFSNLSNLKMSYIGNEVDLIETETVVQTSKQAITQPKIETITSKETISNEIKNQKPKYVSEIQKNTNSFWKWIQEWMALLISRRCSKRIMIILAFVYIYRKFIQTVK